MNTRNGAASRPRTLLAALAATVLALGLAACSPDAKENELKTDSNQVSMVDWRQKVDDCMLKAGFDLTTQQSDDGKSQEALDTSGFDMVEFDKSYAGCIAKIGEAPVDENMPSEEEIFESQLIFAACMRAEGYDYPDPEKGSAMSSALSADTDPDVVDKCSAKAFKEESGK